METQLEPVKATGIPQVWPSRDSIYTSLSPERALEAMSSLTPPMVEAFTREPNGGVMTVIGYAVSPSEWSDTHEETGEVTITRRRRVAIVTEHGATYATESETFAREFERIVAVFGQPTPDNPVTVRVYQRRAKMGHSYGVVPYVPLNGVAK